MRSSRSTSSRAGLSRHSENQATAADSATRRPSSAGCGDSDQVDPWLLQRAIDVRSADQSGADHGNGYPLHGGLSAVGGRCRTISKTLLNCAVILRAHPCAPHSSFLDFFRDQSMSSQDYAPKRKISSFYPPQRHLMGPGPSEIHPAGVFGDGQADHRLPRPGVRGNDGGVEGVAALRVPDAQRADLPGFRPRLGGDGDVLRQHDRSRRQGRSFAETACSAAA